MFPSVCVPGGQASLSLGLKPGLSAGGICSHTASSQKHLDTEFLYISAQLDFSFKVSFTPS